MDHKKIIESLNTYWKKNDIFKKSIESRPEALQVVTFDWPPFASWTPHYGHGLVSIMKDTLGRFKTMQGYRVERIRWRDCHGLPVEKFVEKQLWLDGKKDIEEKLWVEKFVEACRSTVRNVNTEWKTFVDMIGRWADMDNAYFTMDLDYMESVMWVFGKMYDKNLVYRWFSVQWYCPSCATALSNSEVNEWYKDRQDPATTVKFQIQEDAYIQYVVAVIKDKDGNILSLFNKKHNNRQFPWGKLEKNESPTDTLVRELKEELGIDAKIGKKIGEQKKILQGKPSIITLYEVTTQQEPIIQEKNKHAYIEYIQTTQSDNKRGYIYKAWWLTIDDEDEIAKFHDLLAYKQITKGWTTQWNMYFLAWTTTPRTLPSNMFLAVGKNINYVTIFDNEQKEYYILAEDLLWSYYKTPTEYTHIATHQGSELAWISYTPLWNFYEKSKNIAAQYKSQVHKVITWDFVTTESGTGIVHIAPAFWQDDFDVVKTILPKDDADNRLFLPVNEYGEFTQDVPDRKGTRCYDANKDIIQNLKKNNQFVAQNTINHSYPHCRRCETPLIYKAMTSWFIKEQNIAQNTIPWLSEIWFIPDGIKNRFRDVLKSAPDWNVSRNRYRWAPIPIWQSEKNPEERIVIKNLDELYQHSKTGSVNITKNIIVRNAETQHNEQGENALLTKKWQKQAQTIKQKIQESVWSNSDIHIVISPLHNTFETIYPYIETLYNKKELADIQTKYTAIQRNYQSLQKEKKLLDYYKDPKTTKYFSLADGLAVDFRIADIAHQEKEKHTGAQKRVLEYITYINERNKTKTIITVADSEWTLLVRQWFRSFDEKTQHEKYHIWIGEIKTHYRDNKRQTEIDLHKPYVDDYRFEYKWAKYKRIPEVLDCWFESWAMPYGQVNYIGDKKNNLNYPADYIIEWLDQTRWWFRTLHVLWQGIMNKNAFHNVIINGLILAEDGKKMSKKLKNYPEPSYLFEKYGTDALRMYLLTSPAVRSEPVRLWESLVEQMYKDFSAPLSNAYNFFATYAKIDKFKAYDNQLFYLQKNCDINDIPTEKLIRMDIKTIVELDRESPLSKQIHNLLKSMQDKKVDIQTIQTKDNNDRYTKLIQTPTLWNTLIIWDAPNYKKLWKSLYGVDNANPSHHIIPLINYEITNDLDRWILAALHNTIKETENYINTYMLDGASKEVLWFIDKLTNRYIRRSRRRFRATGMDADKNSAYNTLYTVLYKLLHTIAPFAPFISEHIRQQLQEFSHTTREKWNSIHLSYIPVSSTQYIDQQLLDEIELVRRIISLGLFVRSKNNIKIKQPLSSLSIRIE